MRLLNLLEVMKDDIMIENANFELLYKGSAEYVPYYLTMKYVKEITTYNNMVLICIK